jgi:4-hydroxybenzoate polyprenyltransferase
VTGTAPWEAWSLGLGVTAWVAGFDMYYSLFDLEHDRREGLHSIAARFGERGAFAAARLCHVLAISLLALTGAGVGAGWLYWTGLAIVAALLAYEGAIVRPGDLRRLDAAFFTLNGVISIVYAVFVALDVLR